MKLFRLSKVGAPALVLVIACHCFGQAASPDNLTTLIGALQRLGDSSGLIESGFCQEDAWSNLSKDGVAAAKSTPEILTAVGRSSGFRSSLLGPKSILIFSGGQPALLSTKLQHFQIDYGRDVRRQLHSIWFEPEFAKQAAVLGIVLGPFSDLGMVALGPNAQGKSEEKVDRLRHYDGLTVLQILSDSLKARRGLIWSYGELLCDGKRNMQFEVVDEGS